MLTFETDQIQGATAIVGKLTVRTLAAKIASWIPIRVTSSLKTGFNPQGLPFEKVQHRVSTMDAQPSSPTEASIVVLVTGQLLVSSDMNVISVVPTAFELTVLNLPMIDRRRVEPLVVLPGVPPPPRRRIVLRRQRHLRE